MARLSVTEAPDNLTSESAIAPGGSAAENIPSAIKVDKLHKTYGNQQQGFKAIGEISFSVAQGEFVSFFGPNGCGKSTLLNLISGLDCEYDGAIEVFGAEPDPSIAGFVFQNVEGSLLPWLTVLGNVTFGLKMNGMPRVEREERGLRALEQVGLSASAKQYPYKLSGGMKQRVSIARALAGDAGLLILDEPFSALDYSTVSQLEMELLRIWEERPITTLLVSHDPEEAILLSDRIFLLSSSPARIVEEVVVPLPRPRTSDMVLRKEFIDIRSHIVRLGQDKNLFAR